MNIGELFVNLGIKGSDKTVKELGSVQKGMSEVYSTSLEAKVAIVGAMYALEQLFAASGKMGTNLSNFNAILGVSTQTLQEYQFAARQVGVSNEAVEGTFKSLQSSITKTLTGQGAPKGLSRVAMLTGGVSTQDLEAYQKSPELFLKRLQQYAQKEGNAGLRNEMLRSFGLGDDMIAALVKNTFTDENFKKAPKYSEREVQSLAKADAAWRNLGVHIQMAIGHFNSVHGGQLVGDISKITDSVLKLGDALVTLSEKLKFFKGLGILLDGIANFVKVVNADINAATGNSAANQKDPLMRDAGAGVEQFNATIGNGDWWVNLINEGLSKAGNKAMEVHNHNYNVKQNMTFPDTKDPQRLADHVGRHTNNALRQSPAQKQAN